MHHFCSYASLADHLALALNTGLNFAREIKLILHQQQIWTLSDRDHTIPLNISSSFLLITRSTSQNP